uniref:SLC26A/SulP transporter domain-containing protein n=1 Tax=Acrobeloides nanus TaxID=290746 RepID=A0A914D731_9BILA
MSIIAHIPTGFPTPAIPKFSWFTTLLPDAIIIAIVIYAVTISVAKLFAQKHNYVEVRALAVCQMISSFLLCMPASGGLARSTLNSQIGSKSQVTSIVSSSLMLIVILWVGPLLYDLPTCVLSAIIAIALRPMFRQFLQLELLWKTSFYDFLIWIVSFVCTVTWDVSEGLICAIGFALLTVIVRIQW